jgi:hypothetical protein
VAIEVDRRCFALTAPAGETFEAPEVRHTAGAGTSAVPFRSMEGMLRLAGFLFCLRTGTRL